MRISDWSSDVCSSDLDRAEGVGQVERALPEHRIAVGGLVEDAVDAAEIGTAAQIEDVEALELLELIFAVVVVKPCDELERLADGRQDPHFLGELLEPLGKRSEEHTSELQSLMRISYAVFCLKKKIKDTRTKSTVKIQTITV